MIERERITGISMMPAQLTQLVGYPELDNYDLSSPRIIHIGGAFLAPHLGEEAERKLAEYVGLAIAALDRIPRQSEELNYLAKKLLHINKGKQYEPNS